MNDVQFPSLPKRACGRTLRPFGRMAVKMKETYET